MIKKEAKNTMSKILIIEGNPLMSKMYQKIFTFEKYEVEVAADDREGLDRARYTERQLA